MKKNDITIRSSAAEYLVYMAAVGDNPESIEIRYLDEKCSAHHLMDIVCHSFPISHLTILSSGPIIESPA